MKIAPAGKKNENCLPFSMRGVLYAPKMPRGGHSSHVRPAIPTRSMRTCQSLWDKGGGLSSLDVELTRHGMCVAMLYGGAIPMLLSRDKHLASTSDVVSRLYIPAFQGRRCCCVACAPQGWPIQHQHVRWCCDHASNSRTCPRIL